MSVERPDRPGVSVDVDSLGGVAAEIRSLLGLTDWRGVDNLGLPFGNAATFDPAEGLAGVHDANLTAAWGVVRRMEAVNARLAEGLAEAVRLYGASDRHSAAAVAAAAGRMRSTTDEPGG